MPDDDGLRPNLGLPDEEPEHALLLRDLQRLSGGVELGEEALQAIGKRDVRFGVQQLRLERGELGMLSRY
jgi:hypothetical protein